MKLPGLKLRLALVVILVQIIAGRFVYEDATVDITLERNTQYYGFEETKPGHGQEDCKLFVMNYGYRCNRVIDGWFYNLWRSEGDERVCEIMLFDRNSPKKIVELIFTDGSRKYYHKPFTFFPWKPFTLE